MKKFLTWTTLIIVVFGVIVGIKYGDQIQAKWNDLTAKK